MDLNIAFLQLLPGKTQEENLEKGLLACRESKEKGADIALFPEIWNIGYDIDQEPETLRKLAVSVDSPFVTVFQELAKELQMAIGITFLESYHPAPHPDCNGHSTLFDGVIYFPDQPGSRDTCVLETPEEEGIYLATLDLSMLRNYREDERPGAWRHPEKYEILTDAEIAYPFCP